MFRHYEEKLVEEIRRLSQDEGLHDHEIAEEMACSRATVNRKRLQYAIPKANLNNRKDKTCLCGKCGKVFMVRRKELRGNRCETCADTN